MLCPRKHTGPPCSGLKLVRSSFLGLKLRQAHELLTHCTGDTLVSSDKAYLFSPFSPTSLAFHFI